MELNLNTVQRPTLNLTLMDEEQTVLRVKMPTQDMFKQMMSMEGGIDGVEDGDKYSIDTLYVMLAHLLSHNRDRITVTPDELRYKYNVDLESAIIVYRAYLDFINTIIREKN